MNKDLFIVVEIASNHNGDLELCKKMFRKAKECGADAVKLQKRNNRQTFMKSILNSPYQSEYAKETGTYGEHREYLDRFDYDEFIQLRQLADEIGIIFFVTPFDFDSVDFLEKIGVPMYKVASCDFKNYPLIEYIAQKGKPMILSTGGATYEDMDKVYQLLKLTKAEFSFLYCISIYPNNDNLNLLCINEMTIRYPDINIGFSSHHPGILPIFIAHMCGARIFEVHFTFNRGFPGSDHGFSLEPQALRKICFDLKRLPLMLGDGIKRISEEELKGFIWKFGKSVHIIKSIKKGEIITKEHVAIKAPADGIEPHRIDEVIGAISICDLSTSDILTEDKIND